MPFGLTNAPATFQALMNDVFRRFLWKFVLVFFDDIVVYSRTVEEHIERLSVVLTPFRSIIYLLMEKNVFSGGHNSNIWIISGEGDAADDSKVPLMLKWPTPQHFNSGHSWGSPVIIDDLWPITDPLPGL